MKRLWLWLMLCILMVGSAFAATVTGTGVGMGFHDNIVVTLTLVDGVIKDVAIDHNDTAGIADSAISKLSNAIVNNNSINVDAATGATFTSKGILEAAKNALIAAGLDPDDYMEKVELEPEQPTHPDKESNIPAGAYTGTAKGFAGDITVGITLKNGRITAVYIDHNDTAGIADSAISKLSNAIVNNNSINVDAATGATFTSKGILEAAKNALIAAGLDPDDYMEKVELEPEQPTQPDKESNIPAGAYTGTAKGFAGDITVGITLKNGKITAVYVEHDETPQIGGLAVKQLAAAIENSNSINVDTVTNATLTSRGILEAAKNALLAAGLDPNDYMGEDHVTVQPGDSDSDGVVTLNDAIAVLRYCIDDGENVDVQAVDVTGDGKADVHDALRILQYLAGWSVSLQ